MKRVLNRKFLINFFFLFIAECHFGKELKELGSTWFPDLGAPFGKMYCIKCQCIPVSIIKMYANFSLSHINASWELTNDFLLLASSMLKKMLCLNVKLSKFKFWEIDQNHLQSAEWTIMKTNDRDYVKK